ncbi:MAG: Fe-S cluster assembly protein SufD [Emcibacteraceae bacterium]|nr:Fe-S cluster assembly protein SufD [Emcibacteraceae bacterium]MDG1858097.1 Fe-S cluster assembly protein SufD [Emcibacteraceae bacterium]
MTNKNHFDASHYAEHYKSVQNGLEGLSTYWLVGTRDEALSNFIEVGLPGPKVEEWKYTNLSILKSKTFESIIDQTSPSDEIARLIADAEIENAGGSKVVFIDGHYAANYSKVVSLEGICLLSLNEFVKAKPEVAQRLLNVSDEDATYVNLNSALMTDGYVLLVTENTKLSKPIQIIHVASDNSNDKALRNKNIIALESNASAQIIESFSGADDTQNWQQDVTKVSVAKNSVLEIYQIQQQGNETIHMGETHIDVDADAKFKHYSLNVGAKISRTEIKPTLNGLHGNVELRGAFLGRDGNSHDVFTHMKHLVPECDSDQIYRGVLDKGGKSAFQGKVYVAKDAQLTNADQSNKNMILDRDAEANSKPELLIYADDVKCSHGATVGELDQEAMFYLNSRGLDKKAAKSLLVEAFVAELYEDITIEAVRDRFLDLARSWLA